MDFGYCPLNTGRHCISLRTADAFPVVASLPPTTGNASAVRRLALYMKLRGEELYESRSSQVKTQLLQLRKESLEKIRASTGFEPLTSAILS